MVLTGLLLGAMLGFVLQRGRFCVTGAFRDVWLAKNTRWLLALFIVIAVQALGVFALQSAGVITLAVNDIALWAVVLGSFIFGIGIVLAGGCATGTYYRSGEGLVGSWMALGTYGLLAAAMKYGALQGVNDGLRGQTVPASTLQDTLGISPWFIAVPFAALIGYFAWRHLNRRTALPKATLPPRHTGLRHLLFEKAWHPFATALVVAVIAIAAYPLSYATGRKSGLGITTPSADLVSWFTTGESSLFWNWGVMLILGILVGSYIAAKGSGEFKVRVPDAKTTVRSLLGGVLMGVGAAWAGGCTIGNSMVQTALFSYQGWAAMVFTFLGVGLGAKIFITGFGSRSGSSNPVTPSTTRAAAPVAVAS